MDGNMRRLPPWMLAAGSSGLTETSNRSDNKSDEVKRKHEAGTSKAEKRPRRTIRKTKERDDSEEPKKVGIRTRGGKIRGSGNGKKPEITQSATGPEDENLTVDDLLSFAQEYVESENQTGKDRESLSVSESMVVMGESTMRSSKEVTKDPARDDMLDLLLGPFFKKPK